PVRVQEAVSEIPHASEAVEVVPRSERREWEGSQREAQQLAPRLLRRAEVSLERGPAATALRTEHLHHEEDPGEEQGRTREGRHGEEEAGELRAGSAGGEAQIVAGEGHAYHL